MKKTKKPTLEALKEALEKTQGNLTNTAVLLGCCRASLWEWGKRDPKFAQVIDDSRKKFLDNCLTTARVVALGIPVIEGGKVTGWKERPDSQMLRYFISTLGRNEGFGENLDITTNGKDINQQIKIEVIDRREDVRHDEEKSE